MSDSRDAAPLLIIRERDVGMFSLYLQVLNTLRLLHEHGLPHIPVVVFGRGCAYFDEAGRHGRRSVWEYHFEPIVPTHDETVVLDALGPEPFDLLESMRRQLERGRGKVEFPEHVDRLSFTAGDRANVARLAAIDRFRDAVWTDAFTPEIDGHRTSARPVAADRQLVRDHLRVRSHISAEIDAFHERHLRGRHVIGVHVRGTDGFSAPARGVDIGLAAYFSAIESELEAVGGDRCRVFLATDEAAYVDAFRRRFGDLIVAREIRRSTEADGAFGRGPTGQVMPAYVMADRAGAVQNGADVVVDHGLLCRADLLVHNVSSVSMAAAVMVDRAVSIGAER